MPGCMLSATKASFSSVEKRRLRATPVITSTFENVSDIGIRLGLSLGPPAKAGVRCKRGAVQYAITADPRETTPSWVLYERYDSTNAVGEGGSRPRLPSSSRSASDDDPIVRRPDQLPLLAQQMLKTERRLNLSVRLVALVPAATTNLHGSGSRNHGDLE